MKQRVMQKTLSERQKQIEAQRAASRALAQKAFAIDEIAKANKAYIDAEFAAMASGDDKAKTAEKAAFLRLSFSDFRVRIVELHKKKGKVYLWRVNMRLT